MSSTPNLISLNHPSSPNLNSPSSSRAIPSILSQIGRQPSVAAINSARSSNLAKFSFSCDNLQQDEKSEEVNYDLKISVGIQKAEEMREKKKKRKALNSLMQESKKELGELREQLDSIISVFNKVMKQMLIIHEKQQKSSNTMQQQQGVAPEDLDNPNHSFGSKKDDAL